MLRSVLALLILGLVGCAPSADVRIPNADGSIREGRLVIVPLRADGDSVEVWDELYASAEFSGASEHDDAFWTALTAQIQAELGWDDVRLHDAVPGTDFAEVRALIQGGDGFGSERWSVKTLLLPASVDYAAFGADHVLFVRQPTISRETRATGASFNGVAAGRKRVLVAQAGVVWMDSRYESPLLVQTLEGVGDQRGALFDKELNRDSWDTAVEKLAQTISRRVSGPQ